MGTTTMKMLSSYGLEGTTFADKLTTGCTKVNGGWEQKKNEYLGN